MIKCKLCDELFRQITNTHLRYVHGTDKNGYLERYPDAKTVSDETMLKYISNKNAKGNISPRKGLTYEEYYGEEKANKTRVKMRRPLSNKTRTRLSTARYAGLASGDIITWNKGLTKETSDSVMRISKAQKSLWKNQKSREVRIIAIMEASHIMPNKAEMKLSHILRRIAPRTFYYNGDFRLGISIGRKIPDFINMNGKKQVVELFGDYWHQGQDSGNLTEYYAKYHYNCLVIWEHELYEDNKNLRKKILDFVEDK